MVDPQFPGTDDETVVPVHGEVAERMRRRRTGGDQHERAGRHQDGRTGRERASAHGHLSGEPGTEAARGGGAHFAPPSAVSVFSASFAPTGEKPGLSFSAADRLLRASFLLPVACSIIPRW